MHSTSAQKHKLINFRMLKIKMPEKRHLQLSRLTLKQHQTETQQFYIFIKLLSNVEMFDLNVLLLLLPPPLLFAFGCVCVCVCAWVLVCLNACISISMLSSKSINSSYLHLCIIPSLKCKKCILLTNNIVNSFFPLLFPRQSLLLSFLRLVVLSSLFCWQSFTLVCYLTIY